MLQDRLDGGQVGILSEIRFLPDGEVDPNSGTFRAFTWNPDAGIPVPREFDWAPSEEDEIKP